MVIRKMLKSARFSIVLTIVAATIFSFSLCLVPFTSGFEKGKDSVIAYIISALFWIGLIIVFFAARSTKKALYRYREKLIEKGYIRKGQRPGIISFSNDLRMLVMYCVTVIGIVVMITDIFFSYVPETVMFPIISVTMLSFTVHCVLDGKYYKAYKLIKERVNNETKRKA